jgi:hypothetical protein
MSTRAVELAWGLPERKRIDRPAGSEEWTWPAEKRRASFQDERLVRWGRWAGASGNASHLAAGRLRA